MQNQRLIQSKNFVTRNDVNRFGKKNVKAMPKKIETLEKIAIENENMIHPKEVAK